MKKAIIITEVDDKFLEDDFENISIDYSIIAKNKKDGGIYYSRYLGPADIKELPQNKEIKNYGRQDHKSNTHLVETFMNLGYNKCLEEILGKEKE